MAQRRRKVAVFTLTLVHLMPSDRYVLVPVETLVTGRRVVGPELEVTGDELAHGTAGRAHVLMHSALVYLAEDAVRLDAASMV